MGAALHLAHAHQIPPGPKRKRKDGDGGDGSEFARYAHRIYRDQRADHESKELLLAIAYALTMPREEGATAWTVAREALGADRIGRARLDELVGRDAPCYKSPAMYAHRRGAELYQKCRAPRLRPFKEKLVGTPMISFSLGDDEPREPEEDFRNKFGICGNDATEYAIEKLPDTGWHKPHWYCTRHRAELVSARIQLKEGNARAPKPIPNWGGLLGCYFEADWVKVYRHYLGERWEPPVYGIRADEWPIPGVEAVPMRARLRLAALDGELLTGGAS